MPVNPDLSPPEHDPRTQFGRPRTPFDSHALHWAALILPLVALVLYLPLHIAGTAVSNNAALASPLPILRIPIAYTSSTTGNNAWFQTWILSVYINGACAGPLHYTNNVRKPGKPLYPVKCFYNGAGKTFNLGNVMGQMMEMSLGPGDVSPDHGYDGQGFTGLSIETAPGFAFALLGMLGMAAVIAMRVAWPKLWTPHQRAYKPTGLAGFKKITASVASILTGVEALEWVAWTAWVCSVFAAAWFTGQARDVADRLSFGDPFAENPNEYTYAMKGRKGPGLGAGWAAMMWIGVLVQAISALCLTFYFILEREAAAKKLKYAANGPVELTNASQKDVDEAFEQRMKAAASHPVYMGRDSRDSPSPDPFV